jgi:hypothetical protein
MAARNDGGTGRSFRPRQPVRPVTRPRQVWVVSILLVLIGVLGGLIGAYLLKDALDHGDDNSVVVLAAIAVAVGVAQLVAAGLVFAGVNWGRGLATVACGLNLVGGLLGLVNGAGGRAWLGIVVNIALIGTLAGKDVAAWCR